MGSPSSTRRAGTRPPSFRDAIVEALDDPACPDGPALLFDMRGSESIKGRTALDVKEMARFLVSIRPRMGGRLAIVTDSDVAYGLMRLGSVFAAQGGLEPEVFRGVKLRRTWLLR